MPLVETIGPPSRAVLRWVPETPRDSKAGERTLRHLIAAVKKVGYSAQRVTRSDGSVLIRVTGGGQTVDLFPHDAIVLSRSVSVTTSIERES